MSRFRPAINNTIRNVREHPVRNAVVLAAAAGALAYNGFIARTATEEPPFDVQNPLLWTTQPLYQLYHADNWAESATAQMLTLGGIGVLTGGAVASAGEAVQRRRDQRM